jgi:hypothetical protein
MGAYAMSMMLAFVLPIYLLRWVHSRKSADIYAALPFSRRTMLLSTLLLSFLVPTLYFLCFGGLYALIAFNRPVVYTYMTLLAHTAFSVLCIILFNTAVWLAANNSVDGIILLGAYTLMPVMLSICLSRFLRSMSPVMFSKPDSLYLLSPVFSSFYNTDRIIHMHDPSYSGTSAPISWKLYLWMALIAVIAALTLRKNFIGRKMERAEQLSDGFFAYPFVIGVYTAFILLMLCADIFTNNITLFMILAVFAVYMISQFIYRRQLKPTMKMILSFVLCLAVCLGTSAVTWYSECFHAADHLTPDRRYVAYNYDSSLDREGMVNCTFTLTIDRQDAGQQEAAALMNSLQAKMTDAFYGEDAEETDSDGVIRSYQSLLITTADTEEDFMQGNYTTLYSAYIDTSAGLDQEDLKMISRYTDVTVYVTDEDTFEYEELSYDDYLKKYGGEEND